jgi:cytochrome P450
MIDLQSPSFHINPYPKLNDLRENTPVCRIGPGELWAISRFEDVQKALRHSDIFTSRRKMGLLKPQWLKPQCQRDLYLLTMDPPEYTSHRKLIDKPFTAASVRSLVPVMEKTIRHLIEDLQKNPCVDFFEKVAYPFVGNVVSTMLGMEGKQSADDFRQFIQAVEVLAHKEPSPAEVSRMEKAIIQQSKVFDQLIAEARERPSDSFLGQLVTARSGGELLSNDVLRNALDLLIRASFIPSAQQLGNIMVRLSREPDLLSELSQSPEKIPAFVDEMLRLYGSVPVTIRHTTQDVTIQSVTIPENAEVLLLMSAANRDPRHFQNPDKIDLTRPLKKHLAFGFGPHVCVGLAIARQQAETALTHLLPRLKRIDCPSDEELAWLDSSLVRGLKSLPLTFQFHTP